MANQHSKNSSLRIIDASVNRAMEGLRVIEEFTRMHLNDALLSESLKNQRHLLGAEVSRHFANYPLVNRDILHDVGTEIQTPSEYKRTDLIQIVRANFARTLQSLRSIEEYSKFVLPEASADFEKIRYGVYALEKAVVNVAESRKCLNHSQLYVLTDSRNSLGDFEALIDRLVDAGVDLIQLRDKKLEDRELVEVGNLLSRLTSGTETRWIMNDRADLAEICNADGVHLGQTDLEVAEARRIVGANKLIGVSTHNFTQATEAVMNGANYIGVGPVFESQTKSFDSFAESQFVERVTKEISLPAFAIGGIDLENLDSLIQRGVTRIAVSGCVVNAADGAEVVAQLKKELSQCWTA